MLIDVLVAHTFADDPAVLSSIRQAIASVANVPADSVDVQMEVRRKDYRDKLPFVDQEVRVDYSVSLDYANMDQSLENLRSETSAQMTNTLRADIGEGYGDFTVTEFYVVDIDTLKARISRAALKLNSGGGGILETPEEMYAAGGAAGGLVLLCCFCVILACFCCGRKKRHRDGDFDEYPPEPASPERPHPGDHGPGSERSSERSSKSGRNKMPIHDDFKGSGRLFSV